MWFSRIFLLITGYIEYQFKWKLLKFNTAHKKTSAANTVRGFDKYQQIN